MRAKILLVALLFFIVTINCAPDTDLVTDLPADYPYDYKTHKVFSGYLNIEGSDSKKIHYMFLESQNDPANDPLVIWFTGGPGCSGLLALSEENGPTYFDEETKELKINDYSWNKKANMIYFEQPAGVGFSIAGKESDYKQNDETSGDDNLKALLDWFTKFPEYKNHKFYISGESYGGVYIPFLATNILKYNLTTEKPIDLQGIIVGNGYTDPEVEILPAFLEFAWSHNLYSDRLRNQYLTYCSDSLSTPSCNAILVQINQAVGGAGINIYDIYMKCTANSTKEVELENGAKIKSYGRNFTPFIRHLIFNKEIDRKENELKFLQVFNDYLAITVAPPCIDVSASIKFYNKSEVKKALHVDESITYDVCSDKISQQYTWGKGSYFLYDNLIKNKLRIWIYSGDTDLAVPFTGTRRWVDKLKLNVLKEWRSWRINDEMVAGYVVDYDGLTFLSVRGVGHMVPQYKKAEALHVLNTFLDGSNL